MEYSLIHLCVVFLTVAFLWLVIMITPAIWRMRKSMAMIGEAAQTIKTTVEEIRPILVKVDITFDSINKIINSFNLEVEKIEHITAKFKGLADIIVEAAGNPLIKIISLATGITKGISTIRKRFI